MSNSCTSAAPGALALITGPTAVGKTSLAIEVAGQLGGEILSADSRQVYRHMDIGTAKPTAAERATAVHHFIDIRNPDEPYSAGQFGREARCLVAELNRAGTVPLLVGGSGLYVQAVVDGLFDDDLEYAEIRSQLRHRLALEGLGALYEELGQRDPETQARIKPGDTQRVLRALEVARRGRGGLAVRWQGEGEAPLARAPVAFCLTMDRKTLYQRIEQRVDDMVARGLVAEVEALVAAGYGRGSWAMGTFGYREILEFLRGDCALAEAVESIKRRSRQYAKRQLTWFRRDRRLRWVDLGLWTSREAVARMVEQCRAHFVQSPLCATGAGQFRC